MRGRPNDPVVARGKAIVTRRDELIAEYTAKGDLPHWVMDWKRKNDEDRERIAVLEARRPVPGDSGDQT